MIESCLFAFSRRPARTRASTIARPTIATPARSQLPARAASGFRSESFSFSAAAVAVVFSGSTGFVAVSDDAVAPAARGVGILVAGSAAAVLAAASAALLPDSFSRLEVVSADFLFGLLAAIFLAGGRAAAEAEEAMTLVGVAVGATVAEAAGALVAAGLCSPGTVGSGVAACSGRGGGGLTSCAEATQTAPRETTNARTRRQGIRMMHAPF